MEDLTATQPVAGTSASGDAPAVAPDLDLVLLRIAPAARRGEVVPLDPKSAPLALGRAEANAIRLFTATASRSHAMLRVCAAEGWLIEPVPGRTLSIDGDPSQEAVPLEPGMNIRMGDDHLRCERAGDVRPRGGDDPSIDRSGNADSEPSAGKARRSWNLRTTLGHFLGRTRDR